MDELINELVTSKRQVDSQATDSQLERRGSLVAAPPTKESKHMGPGVAAPRKRDPLKHSGVAAPKNDKPVPGSLDAAVDLIERRRQRAHL